MSGDGPATGEEGFTLVFVTLTVMVMMIFAAFAVDIGAAFNERRQDQSAADSGVLGGAQNAASGSRQVVGSRVVELVRQNLDTTYSDAEWTAAWASCEDGNALDIANVVSVGGQVTECVSFDTSGTFVRVHLPSQMVKTAFAQVMGIDALPVTASATARLDPPGPGGVLPFGVLVNAPDGFQICLRSGATGLAQDPCTGSDQGNFGTVISPFFGNEELGTTTDCTINENTHTPANLALGIDHMLLTHPDGATAAEDRADACFNFGPNNVTTDTGFSGQRIYDGFISNQTFGTKNTPARLQQGDGPFRKLLNGANTVKIDNQPLWEFIDDDPTGTPASCHRSLFPPDGEANYSPLGTQQITQCLNDYAADLNADGLPDHTGVLFGETDSEGEWAVLSSPRFGFVPQFWSNAWGSGKHQQRILAFRPVFLQGLYFKAGTDWIVHRPGEGTQNLCVAQGAGCKNVSLEQLTGFLLPDSTLPSEVIENGPGGDLGPWEISLWR